MKLEKEEALIEAILFLESDPIDINTIIKITDLSKEVVAETLKNLKEKYEDPSRGLDLTEIVGGISAYP